MPQNTSLSLLGTPPKGMLSRSHPTYSSGMYRPEDNAYVQHYASELDLNSLYRNGEYLNLCNYLVLYGASTTSNRFAGAFVNEPGTYLFFADKGRTSSASSQTNYRGRIHRVSMRNDVPLSNTSDYTELYNAAYNDHFGTGYYYTNVYSSPQVVKWTADGTRIFIFCPNVLAIGYASGFTTKLYYFNDLFLSAEVTNDTDGNPRIYSFNFPSSVNGAVGWDAWSIRFRDAASNYSYDYSNVHGSSGGEPVDFQVTPDGTKLIYLYQETSGSYNAYLTEVEFTGTAFEFGSTFIHPAYNSHLGSGRTWENIFNNSNTNMEWTNVVKQLSMSGTPAASLGTFERGLWMGFNFTHHGKKIQAHTNVGWMFTYDLSTAYDISTMSTTPSGYRYFNPYVGNATTRNDGNQSWYGTQWGDSEQFGLNRAGVSFYNNQRSMMMSVGDGRPDYMDNRLRNGDDFGQLNAYFYGVPRF